MEEKIIGVIENTINPILLFHNGSAELISLEGDVVTIRLNGGCTGCPASKITLFTLVEPILKEALGENFTITTQAE